MHTPKSLVACPSCACYHYGEAACPHCGSASLGRPAAAMLLGLALASGCIGKSVAMYGSAITGPYVSISSPADGATVAAGDVEVDAAVGGAVDLAAVDVSWEVDGDAACDEATVDSSGETSCVATLSAGDHTVAVTVADPDSGGSSVAAITLHVAADGGS